MPPRDLTAEDVADWLTPGQAVKLLDAVFQKSYLSKQALLGRLVGGLAEAASEQTVKSDSAGHSWRGLFQKIPAEDWRRIQTTDTCWITGDLIFRRRSPSGPGDETVSHYAVRFRAAGRALDYREYRQVSQRTAGREAFARAVRTEGAARFLRPPSGMVRVLSKGRRRNAGRARAGIRPAQFPRPIRNPQTDS